MRPGLDRRTCTGLERCWGAKDTISGIPHPPPRVAEGGRLASCACASGSPFLSWPGKSELEARKRSSPRPARGRPGHLPVAPPLHAFHTFYPVRRPHSYADADFFPLWFLCHVDGFNLVRRFSA